MEEKHIVYSCHCKHKWGPYAPSYTTTLAFGKHFRSLHSQLPAREEEYKSVIKRIADSTTTGKRKWTGSSPFTIASQLAGMRQPGVIFEEHESRRLLANMVVETNTAFRTVEVDSFQNLMRYCNGQVPLVSRSTLYRDIHKLRYRRLFKEVCQRLQLHISDGARINLTIDAWTASNKIPFLAIRVRYGADGAPKNAGPRPFSPPRPTQRPGAGCLFSHSLPLSALRPPPHPYPRRVPVRNGW